VATNEQLADVLTEFARTMVTDFPIQAILDQLVKRIVEIMPVSGAGVTLIDGDDEVPRYLAASNGAALDFERLQTDLSQGPCLAAFRTNQAVAVADLRADDRFQAFAPPAVEQGLAAVFAFPLRHGTQDALGALDLYRDTTGPLDDDAMHVAQTLADVAAAYILNAQGREDLREASERFRSSSLHDALTGLPNRALLHQLLDQAASRTRRSSASFAVLVADLDGFKDVNDRYGHHVGDELLVAVARRFTETLRPGDVLARLAGDEFVVLCEGFDTVSSALRLADRIVASLTQPFDLAAQQVSVTASVGLAYSGAGADVPEQLLRDADAAMYQAKRSGGGRNRVFDLCEQRPSFASASLTDDARESVVRGQIAVHYQPIVRTDDGSVDGYEALVRWTHPSRGPIPPALLIPMAERSPATFEIARTVLEDACANVQRWRERRTHGPRMAVNVSPAELLSYDYVGMVTTVVTASAVPPELLTFEVTEAVLIADPDRALVVFRALQALGASIALDDFGSGYSSLSYLKEFPVDIVKIDRTFIADLHDPPTARFVRAMVDLVHALDISVTAVGVETAEQVSAVHALGCDFAQGFHYARPVPATVVDAMYDESPPAGRLHLPTTADPVDRIPSRS